jgi:hypothetical protein
MRKLSAKLMETDSADSADSVFCIINARTNPDDSAPGRGEIAGALETLALLLTCRRETQALRKLSCFVEFPDREVPKARVR